MLELGGSNANSGLNTERSSMWNCRSGDKTYYTETGTLEKRKLCAFILYLRITPRLTTPVSILHKASEETLGKE